MLTHAEKERLFIGKRIKGKEGRLFSFHPCGCLVEWPSGAISGFADPPEEHMIDENGEIDYERKKVIENRQ